jgi:DNA polymerase III subunit alpha
VVDFLDLNIKKHPGNSKLKVMVYEPKQNLQVSLMSMAKGFEMNDELSSFLLENSYIDVKVVTANGN